MENKVNEIIKYYNYDVNIFLEKVKSILELAYECTIAYIINYADYTFYIKLENNAGLTLAIFYFDEKTKIKGVYCQATEAIEAVHNLYLAIIREQNINEILNEI